MKQWQDFLESTSADLQQNAFIANADELGLILVTGDDATSFLQNQLSNDISEIDEKHHQLSAYSTPKGRMLAIFRVVKIANGYLLLLPASLVQPILQKLQLYVVQAQVNLADASGHFSRIALQTDDDRIINNIALPREPNEVYQDDNIVSLQIEKNNQYRRYLFLCLSFDMTKTFWDECRNVVDQGNFDSWRLSEINCAIPVIYPQTSEEFVIQMTNLNHLNGVSFKKGCYPGQEIVARMQYLGKLKRRMFISRFQSTECPLAGDDFVTKGKTVADGSGKVIDAVLDDEGNCHCLYVAQIQKAESEQLEWLNHPAPTIKPAQLPYSVATD